MVAVFGLAIVGCSSADLESRVARLEGRVAELEGQGTANSRATATAQPATTAAPEVKPDGPLPTFAFAEENHDFGNINEGDVVEHVFEFENTGDAPLIISDAKGSCGCTVPEWPKEPIGIGEKGVIKVKFNSRKKPGIQNKTVTITANTFPTQTRIKIKADVTPAPTDS
ncbi:DUF1573 domain-containing protein [Reichenbachiella agariperforans]|nr:DUF1573 domain-containing protein [Reichenbachiella agariperforans]